MRILVCGGRDYADSGRVNAVLDEQLALYPSMNICEGGAAGADFLAKRWALDRRVLSRTFRAAWSKHGRAAGAIRNAQMLREFRPDLVIAFPGGRGTADMAKKALAAGVKVIFVSDSPASTTPVAQGF